MIENQTTNQMSPAATESALTNAQHAVRSLAQAATLPEMAKCLTDKAAALSAIGTAIGINLGIAVAGESQADPRLHSDFVAFLARYGASIDPKQSVSNLSPQLVGHGRQFLTELGGFADRLQRLVPSGMQSSIVNKTPSDLNAYQFKVISSYAVDIAPNDPSIIQVPGMDALQAVVENGQWCIDYVQTGGASASRSLTEIAGLRQAELTKKMFEAVDEHNLVAIKELLHEHPNLVNAKTGNGQTPLFQAAFFDYPKTVEFLLAHGADVNVVDQFGKSALDKATFFNRKDIIAILLHHGATHGKQ